MTGIEQRLERSLSVTRMVNARRDEVFRAWTDPAELRWFPNPDAATPDEPIEVDLRVGGAWTVMMVIDADTRYFTGGVYREIAPPEKLVFTWGAVGGWPELEDGLVATLVLADLGETTQIVFRLSFPPPGDGGRKIVSVGMLEGWADTLDRLVDQFAR